LISKKVLRSKLLARRRSMTPDDVRQRSKAIQERVRGVSGWEALRTVLVYLPFQNEADTWALIHELWDRRVQTLAPCCRPDCPGEMDVYAFQSVQDLRPGAYTIPEPDPRLCTLVDPRACDCVLVPGAGFDRFGFRLGFGGGYYDRLLPGLSSETLTIGLAYDFQIVEHLPREPHDQPVLVVCTDQESIQARS
jgi:5-formyltetrahydrofolate cyclo-ligase